MKKSMVKRYLLLIVLSLILLLFSTVYAQSGGGYSLNRFLNFWLLPRVWVGAIFSLLGLVLLWKAKLSQNIRLTFLSLIFFVFAIFPALPPGKIVSGMGIHPSPMCIVTKPFVFLNAGKTIPIIFFSLLASIIILSIIGNKLFCGWVCPIGALQEIIHRIPIPSRLKVKLAFKISNYIRISVFIIFVILIFLTGVEIYEYINPFEIFHWTFGIYGIVIILLILVASLFLFRPFCYLICPLGLITWFVEQLAFIKVRVTKDKCTDCLVCVDESPCPAISSILEEKKFKPDCHACGRCLQVCPENAIKFKR